MKDQKVAAGKRALIFPALARIHQQVLAKGYVGTFMQPAAMVINSDCGPCLGHPLGRIGRWRNGASDHEPESQRSHGQSQLAGLFVLAGGGGSLGDHRTHHQFMRASPDRDPIRALPDKGSEVIWPQWFTKSATAFPRM